MTSFGFHRIPPLMLVVLLLAETALSFGLAFLVLSGDHTSAFPALYSSLGIAAAVGFSSFQLGLYQPRWLLHTRSLLLSTAVGGVAAFPVAWVAGRALGIDFEWLLGSDRLWPTKILVAWIAALFAIRLAFHAALRSKLFVRRVVLLGGRPELVATADAVRAGRAGSFEVVFSANPSPNALRERRVRIAVTTPDEFAAMGQAGQDAYADAGVTLLSETEFWEHHLRRIDTDNVPATWFGDLDREPSRLVVAFNRSLDVLISVALLAFTLPLMLLVALLVKLDSPGGVLYRQERIGLGGRHFTLLKFRSMRTDAESSGPAWAAQLDPRITRVGNVIRRTRIDELPQLLNVLRGEMSLIGPRPERPHFVQKLAEIIPHYGERVRVKPGLTGWAQVNYPYGASVEDARNKLSYDLYYVRHRSLVLDFLILLGTVRVILSQEGAR